MFAVFYIAVALTQYSFGLDITDDTNQDVDVTPIPSEYLEEDQSYIQPRSIEDIGDIIKTYIGNPVIDEDDDTLTFGGPIKAKGTVTIATHYGCDAESCSIGTLDEDIDPEDGNNVVEAVPNNKIRLSSPVKADGKVTITAYFGCEGHSKNHVKIRETDSKAVADEAISEGSVFGGPVHAQGKVSVGTHYGCGAPFGPPMMPPWFSTLKAPPIHYPCLHLPPQHMAYSLPASFVPQYHMPGALASPESQDCHLDKIPTSLEDSLEYLPVASNLANSTAVNGSDEDNQQRGIAFNGIVPAYGTVSIAAKF